MGITVTGAAAVLAECCCCGRAGIAQTTPRQGWHSSHQAQVEGQGWHSSQQAHTAGALSGHCSVPAHGHSSPGSSRNTVLAVSLPACPKSTGTLGTDHTSLHSSARTLESRTCLGLAVSQSYFWAAAEFTRWLLFKAVPETTAQTLLLNKPTPPFFF